LLTYTPTPIQEIHDPLLDKAKVRVLVKREDLNHPFVSGNKWWKLKYNLQEAIRLKHKTLLTFGGAYSNHLYATAAAAHELGLRSIGIVRGEETSPLNPTLQFVKEQGMQLHYISREIYRKKNESEFIEQLHYQFGDFYLIPEGGTNGLAVQGVVEWTQTLGDDFDYLCCAVGTGGTLAGLITGLVGEKNILGFPVLKGGEFLRDEIKKYLLADYRNWNLMTSYHHGGYGKITDPLLQFIRNFQAKTNILLEPVYTGKMMMGVFDLIEKNYFPENSTILIIHTGGLQGWNGINKP
jgi:1-aminocyclopropane-1-carboxylate deaminase